MGHFDLGPQLGALARLQKAIEAQTESTNKQSRVMIWLACAALFLAVVQIGVALFQISQSNIQINRNSLPSVASYPVGSNIANKGMSDTGYKNNTSNNLKIQKR